MFPVIFNAFLYVTLLAIYCINRKKIDNGLVLISLYTFVAILGIFLYMSEPNEWHLMLWPYLYLFITFLLFARPYLSNKKLYLYEKLQTINIRKLKIACIIYIVFALFFVLFTAKRAWSNLLSNEWLTIRTNVYTDELEVYSNFIEWVAYAVIIYCNIAAMVLFFYFLTMHKINKIFLSLLFVSIVLPIVTWSMITASRSNFTTFLMALVVCYIVFNKGFSKKQKKLIMIGNISFVILIIIYSVKVTVSRFGEENQLSSLLSYFGHSFMRFNYGVVDTIQNYMGGKYFFKRFYLLLGYDNDAINAQILTGTHSGNAFITFIGTLYLDWGPWGTLLIALVFPFIINRMIKNNGIAGIYLYIVYLNYLMQGVFVIGNSNSVQWIVSFLIFFLLKRNISISKQK